MDRYSNLIDNSQTYDKRILHLCKLNRERDLSTRLASSSSSSSTSARGCHSVSALVMHYASIALVLQLNTVGYQNFNKYRKESLEKTDQNLSSQIHNKISSFVKIAIMNIEMTNWRAAVHTDILAIWYDVVNAAMTYICSWLTLLKVIASLSMWSMRTFCRSGGRFMRRAGM